MSATLDGLSKLFQATPEASLMLGYWMMESRNYYIPPRSSVPPTNTVQPGIPVEKLPISFETAFFPFVQEEILRNGLYVPAGAGETESVSFRFNDLPHHLDRPIILQENFANGHRQDIYLQPRVTATFKGYPLYENQELVLARTGRELWSQVPLGRALRLAIPLLEKDVATASNRLNGLKQKNEEAQAPTYEAAMRAHLEKYSGEFRTTNPTKFKGREEAMLRELKYNRELAAKQANPGRDKDGGWYWNPLDALEEAKRVLAELSPEAAKAPACYLDATREKADGRYTLRGTILPVGSAAGCEALVTDNPAYFDTTRPRSEAQLLVVRRLGRCYTVKDGNFTPTWQPQPGKIAHGCARHPIFWEQLDWQAVGALAKASSK